MWESYSKRFVFTQVVIVAVCALARLGAKADWQNIAILFAVMQVGGVLGAWWGTRLRKKIESSAEEPPLARRK